LILNSHGEIVDVNEADQMQPAKTQFACGFFACAMAKSMAPVGSPPILSVAQIISDAEGWYAQYDGTDAITNTNGMSLPQLYNLLAQIGLHYQSTATDIATVKQWIQAGYPVIIAVTETSVHDLALGDSNPYPWTASGTHVILVTGVASDGNVLVRDSANCTSLYDPGSLRPGPRTYDAGKLVLVSATAVVPPWMPQPTSSTPPTIQGGSMGLPQGWSYVGTTLHTPGADMVLGFAAHVYQKLLAGTWEADDYPDKPQYYVPQLEASNPALGGGDQIVTKKHMLGYPHNPTGAMASLKNTVIEEWIGVELAYLRPEYATLYAEYQKLLTGGTPQMLTDLQTIAANVQQIEAIAQKYHL